MHNVENLKKIARLLRYYVLVSTSEARSGHPTSCLSATDLLTVLFFGGPPAGGFFHFDFDNPESIDNDRFVLSKGHAAPLLYSAYTVCGELSETELLTLRQFDSILEGHPTPRFPYAEVATGSLGQGLSIAIGMILAMNLKFKIQNLKLAQNLDSFIPDVPENNAILASRSEAKMHQESPKVFVLLGDSEMAEGQVWEAIQLASFYKLNNLVGIIDVNRLGQRGQTMLGSDVFEYEKRISSFGWDTIVVDGHNIDAIKNAFNQINRQGDKPLMIIAKTIKGKGISFLEDKQGWHGKVFSEDELSEALKELGEIDKNIKAEISKPNGIQILNSKPEIRNKSEIRNIKPLNYKIGEKIATRKAYGEALVMLGEKYPEIVVLDAETSNSTMAEIFGKQYPDRFFEMYIAEQNMVGVALGMSKRGSISFVSTFAAFLTRAFDQIRMSQYSQANIKFVGSHCGVSIGADGPSQMGLEDIAMFRSINNSVILYPADAVSTVKLTGLAVVHQGIVYLRTTRGETPVIYDQKEDFSIGGSKTVRSSDQDQITVVTAGITLFEALKAYQELFKQDIFIRVIDLYCIKPVDIETLSTALQETKAIITVEDHYPAGGIGEAVKSTISEINSSFSSGSIYQLAVNKIPRSGKPEELLDFEEISSTAIVNKVKEILNKN